ncbi:ABC transporter permease [Pseudonocardia ailaonensis]|uniref:ABC transporter permease n=1 Tax=Pseudonocardia ailaonensis TaxID=367279 RepID=A0ABN2MKL7_9PSEU
MKRFLTRRVPHVLAVLVIVTFATSALIDLLPGSAASAVLGENATAAQIAEFNARFGLDAPLIPRYLAWIGHALQGDLGLSIRLGTPVSGLVAERIPVTGEIALLAILVTVIVAVPLAARAADRESGIVDRIANGLSSALVAVPAFVMAVLLVYVLSLELGLLPVAGWSPLDAGLGENLRFLIMPVLTLALVEIPVMYRVLRADLLTNLREDFVLAARARGMSRSYVMLRHVLRPSSFSLITMIGLTVGRLLGGTVIVEQIYGLPGLGSLVISSISSKDITVVQGVVVVVAVIYVFLNLVVDLCYTLLDPRVKVAR